MALHRAATPSLLGGTPLSIGLSQIYNLTQISQILDCYAVISQILPAYVLDGNSGKAAKSVRSV